MDCIFWKKKLLILFYILVQEFLCALYSSTLEHFPADFMKIDISCKSFFYIAVVKYDIKIHQLNHPSVLKSFSLTEKWDS